MESRNARLVKKETKTIEPLPELEARIKIEELKHMHEFREKEAAANHQRFLEKAKMLTFLMIAVVTSAVCLYVSFSSRFPQEEKKQASNLVQSLVTGIVGYFAGKANSKST